MRLHFGGCTLDGDRRELRRGGEPVHLSPKALNLLEFLATSYPNAVSKSDILSTIWPDTFVTEANVAILVKEIRHALGDDARNSRLVRTVFGYGYAMGTEVRVEPTVKAQLLSSIAVLPFANEEGPEWDYVSEGITESLINALAGLRRFRVVPRSTSFRYLGSREEPASIGRKLRVDSVLVGRIRVRGDELLTQVDLISVLSEAQLWGERFRRRAADLVDLPDEIAHEITARIQAGVSDHPTAPRGRARNGEAYRLYLLGRHFLSRRNSHSFQRALDSFAEAAEIDPPFAVAHAARAETWVALGTRDQFPPRDIFPLAKQTALRALDLDPELSAAHTALAAVQELFEWDWSAAEKTHLRAVELDPQYATAAQWYALHLARRDRHREAEQWMAKALDLEPASTIINTNAALIAYLARDFDRAVALGSTAVDLDPAYEGSRLITGAALTHTDPERAVVELDAACELTGRAPHILAPLAFAHSRAGHADAAEKLRDEIERRTEAGYTSAAMRALAALACDDHARALELLSVSAEARSPWLSYLKTDQRLDVLRSRPELKRVEAMIGY